MPSLRCRCFPTGKEIILLSAPNSATLNLPIAKAKGPSPQCNAGEGAKRTEAGEGCVMTSGDVVATVVNPALRDRAARWLRGARAKLPTLAELANPSTIPEAIVTGLRPVDPDRPDPANLFRVHWYNNRSRSGFTETPLYLVLPHELTGVRAPIVVVLGCFFPMIGAHKVLAAYGCLIPRLVTGRFDPTQHKAVWPSTGNYCRGGIAISRILDCRGIAVLPAGMSEERFEWLRAWVTRPDDIIRTAGSESNVKEIYDKCAELAQDPSNV